MLNISNQRYLKYSNISLRPILRVIIGITLLTTFGTTTTMPLLQQRAEALIESIQGAKSEPKAPMVASGDNLYIVWWTNKSGNWEVMFRASYDAGETIGDKINLSNSPNSDSQNAEIVASGNNVYVSWWESSTNPANKTSESVLRISTDNGNTFGPIFMLGNNGTIGEAAEGTEEGE
ncbi:MAG TPA: hypothetical protein VKA09_18795 [Nitrososphaeraceae archaeon]|nr:hypothetical protein [Nitrososphaeraceae archaeon]